MVSTLSRLARSHPTLLFLIPYAFLLMFLGLGDSVLQVDEGADTFVGSTILKYGVPRHADGSFSTMSYADVYDGLFVYRTWVPYYLQAASLYLFGKTTLAARLPFALGGVISVVLLYGFTLKFTGRKSVAFLAALFLASSIPAVLYFRTARYVGLPILLTILLLNSYLPIFKDKGWNPWPLTLVSILYFHTMYVAFAGTIAGVLVHFYFHRGSAPAENHNQALRAAGITALFTLPWLAFISPVFMKIPDFYRSASDLVDTTGWRYLKHLAGFLFQLNNYIFPFILLPLLFLKPLRPYSREIQLCLYCTAGLIVVSVLHSIPLQQYIAGCIPLWNVLLALVVMQGVPDRPAWRPALASALLCTNLVHVGPLLPLKAVVKDRPEWFQNGSYTKHAYLAFLRETRLKSVYYRHLFEISHSYRGPLDAVVAFFKTHGKPGESCYIDNEPESLAFYTGMKVIPNEELTPRHRPDWIVLRGDDRIPEGAGVPSSRARIVKDILQANRYTRIDLNAPAMRVNNAYDIQLHLFRSPSSADKITVYRLTDRPPNRQTT